MNTTVIGEYRRPRTHLPGAGGAPEIAGSAWQVFIVLKQLLRTFVERLDGVTSAGYGDGGRSRERLGLIGRGPTAIIADLDMMGPEAKEP